MSQNICNICGANYEYRNGRWVCPACGAYKAEELSNEEVTLIYNAAQKLRLSEFDEAEKAYADIIAKYPQNSEGYWGRLLARFGIKYEEDFDGKQIPTCYATIESIMSDKDYTKAVALADEDTKAYYIKQAEYIERVRKEWLEKARKEKPYDIFISYKDSDAQNGIERTKDSIAAQDLYIHLTGKGYRVFFSRESLRDKVGEKYEPYIFNALSTAKVMIVYGSSSEYVTSTWVKNEWMRYEKKVQAGAKKQNSLIVACDGFSPSELPKALSSMQCLDATKRSFYEDLDKAIDKIIKVEEKPKEQVAEKKTVKKLPIAIAACAVFVAVLLCILIPNLTNQEITSLTNIYYGISVDADRDAFPKGTELTVEEILSGEKYDMVQAAIGEKSESFKVYDIELTGKKNIDINGTVTVKIPLPNDMSATGISAYYVSEKGVAEKLDCSVADGYVIFKTTHFSIYVIAEDKVNNTGFEYKINSNDTVTLNKYTGSETAVVIPQTIEGKTVTEIGSLAFDSMDRITSVNIPDTVTTIGAKAFYGCTSISTITIPETVTSIGTSAFYGWSSSQEIILAGRKAIPSGWNAQWNGSCNAKLTYGVIAIIYHSNGGSGTMSNQEVEINSSVLVSENKFTLAGYTFAGWATSENGEVVILDKGSYSVEKASVYHLYAVWSANENKVIFNANGGSGEMQVQTICTDDKDNLSDCLFTKEGYAFGGWATSENGSVVYSDGGLYTMGTDAEYTLYAIWIPNNNALIFNSNSGFGSMDSITVDTNETINLPKNLFTLDGYTFLGWSEVQNGTVKYTDEQSFTMSSSATITLYAVWRANENELTFNSNDGTNNEKSINMNTGASANLPANSFTREGYTFLGWSTTANGVVEYADGVSYTMGVASTTLYAVWSANDNRIIFNSNGGSGTMDAQTIKTDASANLTNCGFERNGYIFAGWATTPTGNVVYTNGASYTMGADSEYTLYAIWATADYSITYELNGGTNNNSNPAGFDITDSTITLAEPTRAGYTFNGWFSDKSFQNASNTIPSGSTGNKTFYASWSANENTLHFNVNGGSGSIADMKIKTDASATLTKNTLTREGYTFAGWATIANGSADYEDEATYTMGSNSEYTLYAVWEIISYTVTYNTDGGTISGNRTSYNAETETFTLSKPTKFGYTFLGWSGTGITGKQETVTISKGSVGDKEFTANWSANSYTITLNVNGGNALDDNTIDVTFDQNFTLPTPEYKGYTFKGWYYNNTVLVEAGKYDDYDKSIELKAKWEIINYELTYDTDGGTLIGQKTEYNVTTNTFTLPQPTKTGYRFLGWSGTDVEDIQLTVTVSKGNIGARSYTAHWEKIVCTITYETNDGTNSASNPSSYTIDTPDISLADATRSGYEFKGWYSDSKFNNRVLTIDTSNLVNLALYAKWEIITYTITYNMDGGANSPSNPTNYTIHSSNITLAEPTKSSYSFKGWYTDSSFNIKVVSVDTSQLSNVTLYAKWQFDFTYEESDGEITITGYTGGTTAVIPSEIDGMDVISIGNNAFREKTRLVTVIVPDCVENIGMYAFYGCSSLESVEFSVSSKLKTIGSYAFLSCTSLATFNVPGSVQVIESDPFFGSAITDITIPASVIKIHSLKCDTLENINVADSNTTYKSVNGILYSEDEKTLLQYPSGRKDTSFIVPSSVTDITDAFRNAACLEKIIIPTSVQNIASYAFAGCQSLKNIEIPYGENILDVTFSGCSSLISVTIPQSVTNIWTNTFSGCTSIECINYKGTMEQWNAIYKSNDFDVNSGDYTVYCMDGHITKDGVITVTGDVWDGTTEYSFAGGSGTDEDPYLIATAEQLAYVATSVNQGVDSFEGKYLKLTMDICLMQQEWQPIGFTNSFAGYFDGAGHTVYGLSITDKTLSYGGLFGYVNGGTVKNLRIVGANISLQNAYAGIVCGFANNSDLSTVIFDNCHVEGSVNCAEGSYVGGIVGYCNGCVQKSSANVIAHSSSKSSPGITQTCRVYVGGIAGTCTTITDCYTVGTISSSGGNLYHHNSYVGGIVGSGGTITNCYSEASVSAITYQSSYCGGIAGKASTISNSFSVGTLKAKSYSRSNAYVGRIIGEYEDTDVIQNCYADSTQSCTQSSETYDKEGTTNTCGTLQFTQTLQSENFIFNTLGWSSEIWQINEGAFPTLR